MPVKTGIDPGQALSESVYDSAALRCRKIMDYESKLYTLISHLKQEFDFCLIDCPAGIEDGFHFAVSAADRAVVVTSPHISAVRDARKSHLSAGRYAAFTD